MINLKSNVITCDAFNPVFKKLLKALSKCGSLYTLLEHHSHPGLDRHRAAGAHWIARRGIEAKQGRVMVCSGAQEAFLATLSAITRPRETVLTEKVTYAGVRYLAETLHLNLRGIEVDEYGLVPEALETACQKEQITAILVNPTNHNPTNIFMPIERRKAILEIAERAGALLIEDDIFGHLTGHDAPPLAALAPDRCIYVCSLGKSVASGLRVGYILPPAALESRIMDSFRRIYWSSPALMSEIATMLIEEGHADQFVAWHRNEATERQRIARATLGLESGPMLPSYHLWLHLPETWPVADFTAELRRQGVSVAPGDQFAVDQDLAPRAVRLALGAVRDRKELQKGLNIVAKSLRAGSGEVHGEH